MLYLWSVWSSRLGKLWSLCLYTQYRESIFLMSIGTVSFLPKPLKCNVYKYASKLNKSAVLWSLRNMYEYIVQITIFWHYFVYNYFLMFERFPNLSAQIKMGEAKHGMEKIFRGLMTYRLTHQRNMVDQFKKVNSQHIRLIIFFSIINIFKQS